MNIDQKKKLAEWMGWHWNDVWNSICKSLDESPKNAIIIEHWNPDTNYKQFADVWNNLNPEQVSEVVKGSYDNIEFVDMVLNDLPKVMNIVLDVLNIGE